MQREGCAANQLDLVVTRSQAGLQTKAALPGRMLSPFLRGSQMMTSS